MPGPVDNSRLTGAAASLATATARIDPERGSADTSSSGLQVDALTFHDQFNWLDVARCIVSYILSVQAKASAMTAAQY